MTESHLGYWIPEKFLVDDETRDEWVLGAANCLVEKLGTPYDQAFEFCTKLMRETMEGR